MRQAINESVSDRIAIESHDNRNRLSRLFCGACWRRSSGDNQVNFQIDEFGSEGGESIEFLLCIAILDNNVFSFRIANLAQTLAERLITRWSTLRRANSEISNWRDLLALLRINGRAEGKRKNEGTNDKTK
jgi:hypothetical protein